MKVSSGWPVISVSLVPETDLAEHLFVAEHCPGYRWKTGAGREYKQQGRIANRIVYHDGTGFDGGRASPSDFDECSSHGKCHHEEVRLDARFCPDWQGRCCRVGPRL